MARQAFEFHMVEHAEGETECAPEGVGPECMRLRDAMRQASYRLGIVRMA